MEGVEDDAGEDVIEDTADLEDDTDAIVSEIEVVSDSDEAERVAPFLMPTALDSDTSRAVGMGLLSRAAAASTNPAPRDRW